MTNPYLIGAAVLGADDIVDMPVSVIVKTHPQWLVTLTAISSVLAILTFFEVTWRRT